MVNCKRFKDGKVKGFQKKVKKSRTLVFINDIINTTYYLNA